MNKVAPTAISYSKNLTFNFSNTLKDEKVNLNNYSSSTFIIDVDGTVYQGASSSEDSATVTIIGGIDNFINGKTPRLSSNFYLSIPQKLVLYEVMRDLAKYSDSSSITSNSDKLQQSLTALYRNYCE